MASTPIQFTLRDWFWLCVVIAAITGMELRYRRDTDSVRAQFNDVDDQYESLRTCYNHAMTRILDLERNR